MGGDITRNHVEEWVQGGGTTADFLPGQQALVNARRVACGQAAIAGAAGGSGSFNPAAGQPAASVCLIAVDASPELLEGNHGQPAPVLPGGAAAIWGPPLSANRRAFALQVLLDRRRRLIQTKTDEVLVCFDPDDASLYWDGTNPAGNFRMGPAGPRAPTPFWQNLNDLTVHCMAQLAVLGIPTYRYTGAAGQPPQTAGTAEQAAAYFADVGSYQGRTVIGSYSFDADNWLSPHGLMAVHRGSRRPGSRDEKKPRNLRVCTRPPLKAAWWLVRCAKTVFGVHFHFIALLFQ